MFSPRMPPRSRNALRAARWRRSASSTVVVEAQPVDQRLRPDRRNMRGFGLPGCGRGVTVPTSMKPKPRLPSASMCAASCRGLRPGPPDCGSDAHDLDRQVGADLRPSARSARMRRVARVCASVSSCAYLGIEREKKRARELVKHVAILPSALRRAEAPAGWSRVSRSQRPPRKISTGRNVALYAIFGLSAIQ